MEHYPLAKTGRKPASVKICANWAVTQIRYLLVLGAPGCHLYIVNRARSALAPAAGLVV